jgi:hypothetical protein
MNVSITRIQRLIKNASIGLVTLLAVFFSTQVSAQTYVNADQAVQILKNEIESLQERGFNAYNNGSHQLVYDLGYQYRYALKIAENIQSGMSVINAVETSLPVVPFLLGNLETGMTFGDSNLEVRRNALRNYARQLLTQ